MPYGIQRLCFTYRIPAATGTARGFYDALWGNRKIVRDNAITHIFTWPLPAT